MSLLSMLRSGPWSVFRRLQRPRLRFDDAMEARFANACKEARLRHFIYSSIFALVTFNMFLLSDWLMVPDRFDMALLLRLLVFTPVALLLLGAAVHLRPLVLALPTNFLECLVMLMGVAAGLCLVAVLLVTDSPYAGMYRCGLLPILVYGTLVLRLRFVFALAFSGCVLALHLSSLFLAIGEPSPYPELELPMLLVLLVVATYALIMNYRMEMEERRRFVQKERGEALRDRLQASQAQLAVLSRQDALTGVPNRRCFDEHVQALWQQPVLRGDTLAILLMDVDHFKAYNDHHGHPAGDQCLRLVAQALQSALGMPGAMLARWGGEEFIAVLPRADESMAERVAQRLCHVVSELSLRHETSPTLGVVTISVGAAVVHFGRKVPTVSEAVSRADEALYAAKHAGRNQAVLAGS